MAMRGIFGWVTVLGVSEWFLNSCVVQTTWNHRSWLSTKKHRDCWWLHNSVVLVRVERLEYLNRSLTSCHCVAIFRDNMHPYMDSMYPTNEGWFQQDKLFVSLVIKLPWTGGKSIQDHSTWTRTSIYGTCLWGIRSCIYINHGSVNSYRNDTPRSFFIILGSFSW